MRLADGSACAIEDIAVGDTVAAFDEGDARGRGALRAGRVAAVLPGITDAWIELEDGTRVTPNHPYLMEDGSWLAAKDAITSDLRAVAVDGSLVALTGTLLRAADAGSGAQWLTPEPFADRGVMVQRAVTA